MASEGTINPNDLLMSGGLIETGKVGPDNRFTVTSSKTVSPKDSGSDETERKSLLDALDVSDYNIVLRFGPDETQKIGVKTSRSSQDPTLRLRGLLSQMSNNEGALTKVKDNPNALDVLAFKDGVFGLMMEVWNEKDGDLPESIRTYASYYTLEDLVTDQFQSVLLIPGMKEKIDDFDEGLRQKKRADMEEANTTPDQSAGVVTTTVPLPKNIVTDGPNQLEVMYPVIWDSKYDNVVKNNILPYLEATLPRDTERGHSRTDLALMAFERNFIKYETDFSGRILRDKDNNRIPKADQPILDYFNDLYASGEFNDLKRLIDVRTSPSDTLNDFDRDVIIQFVEATDGDLETTTGLISALLPSNKGFKTALGLCYNLQNSNERSKYLAGQIAVRDASRRGLQIVDQAISTYYDSSGNLRGSTVEAEFSLITEGIDYFVGKGAELANIDVNNFNVTNFINNSSNKLAANASGIKGETYKQSAEGRNMLEEEFRKELAKDAQNTDYAQRAFFTLVLAYEVAAAIQGGTGGRTISDQDVALIFRGLRQNWTDSPQAQVSALRAVKGLLSRFELRARMLSSQDVRSGAAYLIAENFFIRAGENIDGMFSLPYIYEELGMEDIPDSENNAGNYYGMTEEDYNSGLLARINNSREAVGKSTFGSLKEAKDDNPTYFGNMQQKYNITLESRGN